MPRRALTSHRLRLAVIAALVIALSGAFAAPSTASDKDDLRHRKHDVKKKINGAQVELETSSKQLVSATNALKASQAKLASARSVLAQTRGELATAQARATLMQERLTAAETALDRAEAKLEKGRKDLRKARRDVQEVAVESLQNGSPSLKAFSDLVNGVDPVEFSEQMSLGDSVSDAQLASVDGLDASKVLLQLNKKEVASLRDKVAKQRAAAAKNLVEKERLEAVAEEQTATVTSLVATNRTAQAKASAARTSDLDQLNSLESERDKIKNKLQAIAAHEARIARRKARAAAKKARQAAKKNRNKSSGGGGGSAGSSGGGGSGGGSRGGGRWTVSHPVNGPITSPYGMRFHPILHVWKLHDGTDFGVGCGTPVYAAAGGKVVGAYYNAGYGNRIILANGWHRGGSIATTYNHLTKFSVGYGQHVSRGQLIGYSGTTGYSTGCHLHFMVLRNGVTKNPMKWF